MKKTMLFLVLCVLPAAVAGAVTLTKDGKCCTAIYAAPEVMDEATVAANIPNVPARERQREALQARVRESVKDLARCLGKMTGTTVPIHTRRPLPGERAIPILIGGYADAAFGPIGLNTELGQGYRLVVNSKGVGMQGETDEGISYAVYELLDRLGCRWYMPGEIGEVIPRMEKLALYAMDIQRAPDTILRFPTGGGGSDIDFDRRNRLGGIYYAASHALESYLSKEQLEAHPQWNAEHDGERSYSGHMCWSNPEVSAAVGDVIIAQLNADYVGCVSLSPGDYTRGFCECEGCKALDTGDWYAPQSMISKTDRYVNFINRIAERVTAVHPKVKFGFLAYVQYTRPPLREKLHPALIPLLAPIDYCRAHTLDDERCPTRPELRYVLEGWAKATKNVAVYEYYFNLAEVSAPFPMIERNVVELPVQYANNVTMWYPETMTNWEAMLPGMHLGVRMVWNTKADPRAILNNFYMNFYGAAGGPMREYWEYIDDLWTSVPEHAGCGFGYMRRFTPEAMAVMRGTMDRTLAACRTAMEYRRVKIADDSLRQFELFMKLRRDFFAGKSATLEADADRWLVRHQSFAEEYKENLAFASWPAVNYFTWFFEQPYRDMARVNREYAVLTTPPVNKWRYAVDKEATGEALGWQRADFDDQNWGTTDVSVDTWAAHGLMTYFGSVWYRTSAKLPDLPADKRVYLWIGATDGRARVFVNGQHVPFVNEKSEEVAEADGYCAAFSFDITDAVKPDAENRIAIIGTRHIINELGTGGLLGPVLIYREK